MLNHKSYQNISLLLIFRWLPIRFRIKEKSIAFVYQKPLHDQDLFSFILPHSPRISMTQLCCPFFISSNKRYYTLLWRLFLSCSIAQGAPHPQCYKAGSFILRSLYSCHCLWEVSLTTQSQPILMSYCNSQPSTYHRLGFLLFILFIICPLSKNVMSLREEILSICCSSHPCIPSSSNRD